MLISGLQKLTLLDYPGRVACTVFTAGCNLRCPFCHNAALVRPERLQGDASGVETVLRFLHTRQGLLEAVAITGGEPLLHIDLPDFLREIRALGYRVKLDSNGSFPERLQAVLEDGLVDRVAMDIKNAPSLYAKTAGLEKLSLTPFEQSKNLLLEGRTEYEFRTTVVRGLHTRESLREAAEWIRGAKEYYLQQFKDSGDLIAPEGLSSFSNEEMHTLCESIAEIVPTVRLRGVE